MMKRIAVASSALAFAAVLALALPALAGECLEGFSCENICPLAKQANTHRASGREGIAVAPSLRAALSAEVARNLSRI